MVKGIKNINKIDKITCRLEVVYSKTKTVYGTCIIKLKVVKGKNKNRLEMVYSKTRISKLKVV